MGANNLRVTLIFFGLLGSLSLLLYCNGLPTLPDEVRLPEGTTTEAPKTPGGLRNAPLNKQPEYPIEALMAGKPELAMTMIGSGTNVNITNEFGDTALIWAAYLGQGPLIARLLAAGAKPNHKGAYGKTALHWAAESGRVDICRPLVAGGSQLDLLNAWGDTPLMAAMRYDQPETIVFLTLSGASLEPVAGSRDPLAFALNLRLGKVFKRPEILEKYPDMPRRLEASMSSEVVNQSDKPVLDLARISQLIHEQVNEARFEHGLGPLTYDKGLEQVAADHSQDMARRDFFAHENPDGEQPTDRARRARLQTSQSMGETFKSGIGENIYMSKVYKGSVTSYEGSRKLTTMQWHTSEDLANNAVTGWMNSPGHRANILNPVYGKQGIGLHISKDGRFHATQNLF